MSFYQTIYQLLSDDVLSVGKIPLSYHQHLPQMLWGSIIKKKKGITFGVTFSQMQYEDSFIDGENALFVLVAMLNDSVL